MCVHTTEAFFQKSPATEAPDLPVCDDCELSDHQSDVTTAATGNFKVEGTN